MTTLTICSEALWDIPYDYNLLEQYEIESQIILTDKEIIIRLVKTYVTVDKIDFVNFCINERYKFYKIVNQLDIPYTKLRLPGDFNNIVHLSILISSDVRNNIELYNTNDNYDISKLNNNASLKMILSDIIFDIKDNITDNNFKILMETLSKITD
jgi:hypothetical protein